MGTLDIQFHEKANSESVIMLLEYLRRRYRKIFAILRFDPLLFFKPVRPTFQAGFRQAARSASHSNL